MSIKSLSSADRNDGLFCKYVIKQRHFLLKWKLDRDKQNLLNSSDPYLVYNVSFSLKSNASRTYFIFYCVESF